MRLGAVDGGEQLGAFRRAVHGEALPFAAKAQIGEKTGGILMEVQEGLAADVENSRPPLDKGGPRSQAFEQIVQSLEGTCASVFHWE